MEVDPQILFRLYREAYLGRLNFVPKKVDVLEIYHYTVGVYVFSCLSPNKLTVCFEKGTAPTISHMSLQETELIRWLNTARMRSPRL